MINTPDIAKLELLEVPGGNKICSKGSVFLFNTNLCLIATNQLKEQVHYSKVSKVS